MKVKEIKLNGYALPERVRAKMILTLFNTHQKKKELGFALCSNPDNIIVPGKNITGISDRIIIDPRTCKKDEKFLGGFHTHFTQDSYPSAEDLHYCGVFKIICSGGNDNKIRCNTFKGEQQSIEEYNKAVYDIRKGVTRSENSKYQSNFDCIRNIGPLFLDEKDIKEKDKELKKVELDVLALNRPGISDREIIEAGTNLINDTEKRDRSARELTEKIKNASKKYYNDVEII